MAGDRKGAFYERLGEFADKKGAGLVLALALLFFLAYLIRPHSPFFTVAVPLFCGAAKGECRARMADRETLLLVTCSLFFRYYILGVC